MSLVSPAPGEVTVLLSSSVGSVTSFVLTRRVLDDPRLYAVLETVISCPLATRMVLSIARPEGSGIVAAPLAVRVKDGGVGGVTGGRRAVLLPTMSYRRGRD